MVSVLHQKIEAPNVSETEYLHNEQHTDIKHELIDGQLYAMTGASNNHNRISGNIFRKFGNHLEGKPCEAFTLNTKIKVGTNYYYPDVVVDCSSAPGSNYFVASPILIVEVLSKTTRRLDLTTKLIQYLNIPSLEEYILIEQETASVQILRRSKNWQSEFFFLGDQVTFNSLGLTIDVTEIYDRVDNEDTRDYAALRQQDAASTE